jgi:hypothetical protein
MKNTKILFVVVVALAIAIGANAATINVPADYSTIQAAINAANPAGGDTVAVAAGTYDEQVVINKSLTLQGAGDTTIVKPSSAANLTQVFSGLFWYGGTKNIAGIIVANVSDGSSVTVKNLKVDESSVTSKPTGADYLAGIFYRETGGTVDTVNVDGGGAWSGGDRAYGMYLSAGTNTVSVEVKGSTFTNFDKEGINAEGNTLTVNIHHNTITGRGSITDEVQNGVDVGRDAVATVNYNTISNLQYGPKTWWAAGILVYHYVSPTGKSATANNNTITNCQIGIMFKNANATAQDNIVSGGTVGLAGIHAQPNYAGAYTASFVHNTVSGITDYSAIDAETFATLTPGTGATLTATISNNTLTGGYGLADGIYVGGGAGSVTATISDNTISDWPEYGINLGDACVAGATITGNTITNNVQEGVHVDAAVDAANVTVNSNNIVGNEVYGVYNGSSGILDANNNWWGEPDGPGPVGPGSGDRVSSNVSYSSWLAKPANDNVVYLEPTGGSIYVKPSETVIVDMKVANLQQKVTGLQAMLNFSSTYFKTGSTDVGVAPGGGVWDELIYDVWNTGGDLDVAVGIELTLPTGTQADATTAIMTLRPTGTEGMTQMVFRADADPDPGLVQSTYLSDEAGQPVWPVKVNSTNIYIDGTPPTDVTISADPVSWTKNSPVVLTFSATDALSGIDHYELSLNGAGYITATSPYNWDVSALATGTYPATVKAIDKAGNEATASTTVYIDKTNPVISITSAKQNSVELIPSGTAVQGVVNIQVTASDATSGLNGHPAVTVTPNGGSAEATTYVNESPSGTFNYTWTVSSTTANGTATINASVSDNVGNSANAASKTFNVNKNQITGQVELQSFVGASRAVTFVATGGTKKTWPQTLTFSGGVASYTLTDVPAGTTNLSTKTAWNLRKKVAVTLDSDGQATVNFTSSAKLLGGDINGSNSINILDYSILKVNWFTSNAVADIDGNGNVGLLDYTTMKANWFNVGDPE